MIRSLETDQLQINSLKFQPPGLSGIRDELAVGNQTFVYTDGNSHPDQLGNTLDKVIYSHRANIQRKDGSMPQIIVTGNPKTLGVIDAWPELRENVTAISNQELIDCLDIERMNEDFGLQLSKEETFETASLLAATIAANLLKRDGVDSQAILSSNNSSWQDHPLLWLKWAQKQNRGTTHLPTATQISKWGASQEGLLYQSGTLEVYQNDPAFEAADFIGGKKWLPSSQLLVVPDTQHIPLSTQNDVGELYYSIALAEKALRDGKPVSRLTVADQHINVSFNRDDLATKRMARAFEILETGLYMNGTPLIATTPDQIKAINRLMMPSVGGARMLPSISAAMQYVKYDKLGALQGKLLARQYLPAVAEGEKERFMLPTLESRLFPEWNPMRFRRLLERSYNFVSKIKKRGRKAIAVLRDSIWKIDGKGRPFYSVITNKYLPKLFREFFNMAVYNQTPTEGDLTEPISFNLWTDELKPIRDEVLQNLKDGDFIAATAFVDEKNSLPGVLTYMGKRVGIDRVVAADHGRSQETRQAAEATGARIADYKSNLSRIDWKKLVTEKIIPAEIIDPDTGLPNGLKGINMLNLIMEIAKLEEEGKVKDQTWILLTDADIMNPGEQRTYKQNGLEVPCLEVQWYDPLAYLGLAILDDKKRNLHLHSVHGAKTGSGRNNYNTHFMFDDWANSADTKIGRLGMTLDTLIWPHTETRAYRWGALKQFLLAKDMQIEQTFDVCASNLDIKTGRRELAQVIIPPSKIEDRPSPSTREWGMMTNLARGLKDMKTGHKIAQKLPLSFTIEDIGEFNRKFAGFPRFQAVSRDEQNSAREPQIAISDTLLPSWNMLKKDYLIEKDSH
jgi:hypothetical protein